MTTPVGSLSDSFLMCPRPVLPTRRQEKHPKAIMLRVSSGSRIQRSDDKGVTSLPSPISAESVHMKGNTGLNSIEVSCMIALIRKMRRLITQEQQRTTDYKKKFEESEKRLEDEKKMRRLYENSSIIQSQRAETALVELRNLEKKEGRIAKAEKSYFFADEPA